MSFTRPLSKPITCVSLFSVGHKRWKNIRYCLFWEASFFFVCFFWCFLIRKSVNCHKSLSAYIKHQKRFWLCAHFEREREKTKKKKKKSNVTIIIGDWSDLWWKQRQNCGKVIKKIKYNKKTTTLFSQNKYLIYFLYCLYQSSTLFFKTWYFIMDFLGAHLNVSHEQG